MKLKIYDEKEKEWKYLEIKLWSFVKCHIGAGLIVTGIIYGAAFILIGIVNLLG